MGLYPNPVVDKALINVYMPDANDVSVEVYSATGQLVYTQDKGYLSAGSQKINWMVNDNVEPGVYYLNVKVGDVNKMEKIIIAN